MSATATVSPPRKPAKLFEVSGDNAGNINLHLSKPASITFAKCRDLCRSLQKAVPTISPTAKGIADAIERLMADIAKGPETDADAAP